MADHCDIDMKTITEHFEFRITGRFRDPLTRQIMEAVRIILSNNTGIIPGDFIQNIRNININQKYKSLNRRGEHFGPQLRNTTDR